MSRIVAAVVFAFTVPSFSLPAQEDVAPPGAAEEQEKIFEPFYTTKSAGGGLGLPTLQGIVLRHQGSIQIEDTIEGNTCFTLLLPIDGPTNPDENAA